MKNWIASTLFLSGMLLSGSDGEYFPWINIAGVCIILIFAALMARTREA